jgi:hypothetical protein
MSKRRRVNPQNKFVMLERWFWRCAAWQALPHPARSLYIEMEMLYSGDEHSNNGEIAMSIDRAAQLIGHSPGYTSKMFKALESGGFIKANQRGDFNWKARQATTWFLTKHPCKGRAPTAEYMHWQPPENSKHGIAARHRKVSPHDTVRPIGHQKSRSTVSPHDTVQAGFADSTVSRHDMLIESTTPYPCLAWHAPQYEIVDRPRGPRSASAFGPWLENEGLARGVPAEYVATALGVSVSTLQRMTAGGVAWTRDQRCRAEVALATYRTH